MRMLVLRLTLYTSILILLLTTSGSSATVLPQSIMVPEAAAFSPLTRGLVDVGGYRLWFQCMGQGTPTVILEAGSGSDSSYWGDVQSGGEATYRICSYDQANLGRSEKASKPRTYLAMARDLHALLMNAQIEGPYILVGHSMGGLVVRVFRDQYPDEVVGLVLEDAAHPDMGSRLIERLPPNSLFESKAIKTTRAYFTWMSTSDGKTPDDPEGVDHQTSNAQARAAKPLGNLPLVVISRSPDNPSFPYIPADLPAETNAALRQIWQDLQGELADLSTSSTRVMAAKAGHAISREEPGLVMDAIGKVVDEARGRMVETGHSVLPAGPGEPAAHAPRILRVEQRLDPRKDVTFIHEDIFFADDAGDAVFFKVKVISVDPPVDYSLSDDIVTASAEEQKQVGLLTSSFASDRQVTYVMEGQMIDQAYNLSEPIRYTLQFPTVQRKTSPYLFIGLAAGLFLLIAVGWLVIRGLHARSHNER